MPALHDDELPVDTALARRLVDSQLPAYAALPVARLGDSGSSNALFALGSELLVRMPRQPGGSETILKEARWLPRLSLPVPTPRVVAVGDPGFGYPEHWSVVRRLPGRNPVPGRSSEELAHGLAAVVTALGELEVPAAALAYPSLRWYRAEPLGAMDEDVRAALGSCRGLAGLELDLEAAGTVWEQAMGLHPVETTTHWVHGDLLAENLLVRDGRLSGVLDFGGLCVGDPTVDLVVAWELLDRRGREVFRDAVGVDDRTWVLGRAWALGLALITFPYYWRTMPGRCANRLVMARQVLEDAAAG